MNLQTLTLTYVRQAYPGITLREIATQTGLELTRIFRIFKGHEMKLSEYQILNTFIEKKGRKTSVIKLQRLLDESLEVLDDKTINEIFLVLERKIQTAKIKSNHYYLESQETQKEQLCLMA